MLSSLRSLNHYQRLFVVLTVLWVLFRGVFFIGNPDRLYEAALIAKIVWVLAVVPALAYLGVYYTWWRLKGPEWLVWSIRVLVCEAIAALVLAGGSPEYAVGLFGFILIVSTPIMLLALAIAWILDAKK